MFFRPAACLLRMQNRCREIAVGFAGGLVGGLTAMPGALPTIWCDLRGLAKNEQRGLVQPFIAAMQCIALALLIFGDGLSSRMPFYLAVSLPALIAGTALGTRPVPHRRSDRVPAPDFDGAFRWRDRPCPMTLQEPLGVPLAGVVASAAVILGTQPAGASEDELEITCRGLLQRYVFNCGCTTEFLEQHLTQGARRHRVAACGSSAVNGRE